MEKQAAVFTDWMLGYLMRLSTDDGMQRHYTYMYVREFGWNTKETRKITSLFLLLPNTTVKVRVNLP